MGKTDFGINIYCLDTSNKHLENSFSGYKVNAIDYNL